MFYIRFALFSIRRMSSTLVLFQFMLMRVTGALQAGCI